MFSLGYHIILTILWIKVIVNGLAWNEKLYVTLLLTAVCQYRQAT